ncbi:MAG: BamA/TamA family outer membrane protein [Myxococcota bacterium]
MVRAAVLAIGLVWCGAAHAQTTETATTTEVRPDPPARVDLGRVILDAPAGFLEVAFVPLYVTVYALDRYSLFERILDVFTNEEQTMAYLPIVIPLGRSGPGFGGLFAYNAPLGSPNRLIVLGIANVNGDWTASVDGGLRLPFASGRAASLSVGASVDRDQRFFGIGTETRNATEFLLRQNSIDVEASLTLLSPSVPVLTAEASLAYRRRRIESGEGTGSPIFDEDAPVRGPPGFNQGLDYPELGIQLGVDTRDSFGLTSRGFVLQNRARLTQDLNPGSGTGGATLTSEFGLWLPLLPRNRTLFFRGGIGSSIPFRNRDDIPFHFLQSLGGASRLRGYPDNRFVDELAWWSSLEYRWFFYEWAGTGGGLVSTLFFDVGQTGPDLEDLFRTSAGNFPWSVGLALRVEQSLIMLGRLQVGVSPEGVQISFGIGDVL